MRTLGLGSQPWPPTPTPRSGLLTTALNSICSAHCPHHAPWSRGSRHPSCLSLLSACPQCPSGGLAISHRAGWTHGLDVHQWMAGGRGPPTPAPLVASIHSALSRPLCSCPDHLWPHLCTCVPLPSPLTCAPLSAGALLPRQFFSQSLVSGSQCPLSPPASCVSLSSPAAPEGLKRQD